MLSFHDVSIFSYQPEVLGKPCLDLYCKTVAKAQWLLLAWIRRVASEYVDLMLLANVPTSWRGSESSQHVAGSKGHGEGTCRIWGKYSERKRRQYLYLYSVQTS